jgi:hypothetical protein
MLLVSMAGVILAVILGLRDLDGTLGGPNTTNTLLLAGAFVAFMVVASLVSFTKVLIRDPLSGAKDDTEADD